jgi:aldose 1-epimerase
MSDAAVLTLNDGLAEVVVLPAFGAGLGRYDWLATGKREPLFRPCPEPATAGFTDLSNFLMVPWSNRISGSGFTFGGQFHAVPPNWDNARFPIHGNGFQRAWSVKEATARRVVLTLASEGPGPFRYDGEMEYALEGGALTMRLAMTNRATMPLPFGGGFHPYLPREPGLTVQAQVHTLVLKDAEVMPLKDVPVGDRPDFDFRQAKALPEVFMDNEFLGWDGLADVRWNARGIGLDVDAAADPRLRTLVMFSPDPDCGFFCIEPVSHRSDVVNRADAADGGLVALAPGERLELTAVYRPRRL